MIWTDETIRALREMWASGQSMAEIAASLSAAEGPVSRSAIAGRIRRLGLFRAPRGPRKLAVGPPEGATRLNWTVIINRIGLVRSTPADGRPVVLLDLGQGCKWPIDMKDGLHLFCNRPRVGRSYCDRHQELSGQLVSTSEVLGMFPGKVRRG